MTEYQIEFTKAASKQLKKLSVQEQTRVKEQIDRLGDSPRPDGVVKLKDSENSYRIRVGSYRVLYDIFDDILLISVIRIGHRKDVYRDKS
ncbi:type II toxin-antitoxin system RelE/ParE family toxin [Rivularia sp. UHCC 0363]|uniref:type II toxin-antitoxin system RelE family toxin n=1 Tax=Rivularia sp. UHCC 0363 TaxID=3110244 RepID=UPI002B1F2947|nr:type II toxin-antitoxin system RelE/ParE family toxin [Rivularia sp. UHCC 0363]MEA5593149.1 type II toxin-antitoxin system RelE/ParE family toxin [Rivularia sp. UHCC 0363]